MENKQNIYSVSQINSYIKNMFQQDYLLTSIAVKGEVSNCKYHGSGHIYFTLKDSKGTITCVMFAGQRSGLKFSLMEGQQVVVVGSVTVYERDGKYQLYAKEITLFGQGDLYLRFEEQKKRLEEMGMFSAEYKQKIPKYCKRVGVVTAATGAAIRDIIQVSQRRNPHIEIILYPAIVQGDNASVSIVNGIRALEIKKVDVIIVGRGGGSIEDLWAFNEEIVAEAIFNCSIPIISAVGHETDFTIADFVSDLRAPTPSAAAEIAVFDYEQFLQSCHRYKVLLHKQMQAKCESKQFYLKQLLLRINFLSPIQQIKEKKMYLLQMEDKLQQQIQRIIDSNKKEISIFAARLNGLSPLEKLQQG